MDAHLSPPTATCPSDRPAPFPPAARRTRAAAAGLHLVFEPRFSRASDRFADSPGYASDHSSPSVSSPYPLTPLSALTQPAVADDGEDNDDCWNLVPYNIPWGPEYYHYEKGTLPGPDGACIFLRSPTPLKNRRTTKACNRCRERKAKCSGSRPACARCLARGYICEYVVDAKRARGPALGRARRRAGEDCSSASSAASSAGSEYAASAGFSPKREDSDDGALYGALAEEDWAPPATADVRCWEAPPLPPGCFQDAPLTWVCGGYGAYASASAQVSPGAAGRGELVGLHAPQPVKSAALPFLSPLHGGVPVDGLGLQHGAVDPLLYAAAYADLQPLYDPSYQELEAHAHYTPADVAYLPPFSDGQDEVAQHYAAVSAYHQDIIEAESLYTHFAA